MITRIEVDGFKSLRGFAMDLEPFTLLVGPNSAGKSNVLEALMLVSRLASQPVAAAFKRGRGKAVDQFSRSSNGAGDAIRFAIEFLEFGDYPLEVGRRDGSRGRFRYELTIRRHALRSGAERLVADEERLTVLRESDDSWIRAHPDLAPYAGYRDAGTDVFFATTLGEERNVTGLPDHYPEKVPVPRSHTVLSHANYVSATQVKDDLDASMILDLAAADLGEPSERIDSGDRTPSISNLPTVLAQLPETEIGEIRADLVSLVPGISSFDVAPEGDEIHLVFELSGGQRLPARLVSAGTLRILALLTAIRMKPPPHTLCIEEPENGIYPGRLKALLELLREVTTRTDEDGVRARFEKAKEEFGAAGIITNQLPTQVLLTTHSPVALAAFRSRPEHLRFVDMVRRNGDRATRVRHVGPPGKSDPERSTISVREIDTLLHAIHGAEPDE